jgi:type IV secretory pathway protease TraF
MLLWNASLSVPIGLYRVEIRLPSRGEVAVVKLPKRAALIASERHYLPRGAWLLKPVAGAESNVVCRFGHHVFIDGRLVARALGHPEQ